MAVDDERRAALDKVWIDGAPRHDAPIHLAPYDPGWPALYEREAARIREALGARVRLLEHAGSTSVPGLSAKPVIDIVLAVPDSADEDAYVPDMVAAGYRLTIREPDWYEHRLFKGPDTNINLHTFTEGSPEIRRMLAFRDRLRRHPEELAAYEATKQDLAGRTWAFVQDYADAKGVVVEEIIARALAEEDAAASR
jgi:GrpB-like predicted nucleotidyltransferase (UPF0157 family)